MKRVILTFLIWASMQSFLGGWGFFAHQHINKMAVYTLPFPLLKFYRDHITYISEHSVDPDKRRYVMKEEACRHYIDLDQYPDSMQYRMPKYWKDALKLYSEDSLIKHGIVPWYIQLMKFKLTKAFKEKDIPAILKMSADIGHYIADANVPLHTCSNYNGQKTNQNGIHGLWESRIPEVYTSQYNFMVGKATYLQNCANSIWQAIYNAHAAVDSVLSEERILNSTYEPDKKYSYEERNNQLVKVYSYNYTMEYHKILNGQVERQYRSSVKLVGDIWYTSWVDAGQPDLYNSEILINKDTLVNISHSIMHECFH